MAGPWPTVIRVPHPATYVAQKFLAWPARDSKKRPKDLAYVYEVAVLTQTRWPELADVVSLLKTRFPGAWFERIHDVIERQFESEAAEGPVAIVRQYEGVTGHVPGHNAVTKTMKAFLGSIGLG